MALVTNVGSNQKLHHYVPQVYLRGFSKGPRKKEQIGVVNVSDGRHFTRNIRRVAARMYFNSIEGDDPLAVENWLGRIETDAKEVIDAIACESDRLTSDDRHALSDFIALQAFRGPSVRRDATRVVRDAFQRLNDYAKQTVVTRDSLAALGFDPNRFDVDAINEKGRAGQDYFTSDIDLSQDDQVTLMVTTARSVLPYIMETPWRIIHFREQTLLTSDAPVTNIPTGDWLVRPHGRAASLQTLVFPLTRKCALTIPPPDVCGSGAKAQAMKTTAPSGRLDIHVIGDDTEANFINDVTKNGADEYVYFHPDDAHLVGL
ncbi:DUF4238 domain-containing protein [Micrococcus luteus]|uniref:DUF4238 domain-containing protein n=1 Tax=Micrococcus luteus TaxID=1270 RepID=UPI001642836B|nr:DUF4238 domain-containing protein [Micrococcus luteus]